MSTPLSQTTSIANTRDPRSPFTQSRGHEQRNMGPHPATSGPPLVIRESSAYTSEPSVNFSWGYNGDVESSDWEYPRDESSSEIYSILRCKFGTDIWTDVLSFGGLTVLSRTAEPGVRPDSTSPPEERKNLFRLLYCPSILVSNGNTIDIVEYTDSGNPKTRCAPPMDHGELETPQPAVKWAVVNHEVGETGPLSREMLYTACLAADKLGLRWLWLDRLCVMSHDTKPWTFFGEAYMGASAVLSFPGRRGLKKLAPLWTSSDTGRQSFLWSPYTFISLFVHSTRKTKCKDNHWIIHEWNLVSSNDDLLPDETFIEYWNAPRGNAIGVQAPFALPPAELLHLRKGVSAMTNIAILLQTEAYTTVSNGRHSTDMRLLRYYHHIGDQNQPTRAQPRLILYMEPPTIIGSPQPHSNSTQRAPDTVIEIKDIIFLYSTVVHEAKSGGGVKQLRNQLTRRVWNAFMRLEPKDPMAFTQVVSWTLGYINEDESIMTWALYDLPQLSYGTQSINGPPVLIRHWWNICTPDFLARALYHRVIDIPLYLRGLDDIANHTRYKELKYYLELNSTSSFSNTSEPCCWIIEGNAMPVISQQLRNGKLRWLPYHPKPSTSLVERMAVFSGCYTNDSGGMVETIIILRRNQNSESWYNEALDTIQHGETQVFADPHWREKIRPRKFEIVVPKFSYR